MIHRFLIPSLSFTIMAAASCGSEPSPVPECDSSQSDEVLTVTDAPGGSVTQCMSRSLLIDSSGSVNCIALELRRLGGGEACECDAAKGRVPVAEEHRAAEDLATERGLQWNCSCEITQLSGPALEACAHDMSSPPKDSMGNSVSGFCYIDSTVMPPIGDPQIVALCPDVERRALRFVGDPAAAPSASILMVCAESQCGGK
jgi:hypothetical protein